jgi:enoyl-[acyl-carrier protein] reductase I
LRRNARATEEVGNMARQPLCSDLASGITGEVVFVDAGFNTVAFATLE